MPDDNPSAATMRVRDLRAKVERVVPTTTLSVPTFMLDYVARALAHAGGDTNLEADEARALGPVPLATFSVGDEVFMEMPEGPWRLVAVVAAAVTDWRLLPCGASVLLAGDFPLRVTDGALEALVGGDGGDEGVDPARILAEAEALTGRRLTLGPWTRRDDELERSATVTVLPRE